MIDKDKRGTRSNDKDKRGTRSNDKTRMKRDNGKGSKITNKTTIMCQILQEGRTKSVTTKRKEMIT